jgi:hypothetical protein
VLSPRQIVSSVPWALIAQQANEIVRDPSAPRYEDCGDGTVADHQTVLQWEKKTGTSGDRSYVNDRYSWSFTGTAPDGDIFTVFLADLNDQTSGAAIAVTDDTVGCLGRRCDWRLPTSVELLTIAESPPVNFPARIDPIFGPTFSSAISGAYWTASTTSTPTSAHLVDFYYSSTTASTVKTSGAPGFPFSGQYVRAVRTGSCN